MSRSSDPNHDLLPPTRDPRHSRRQPARPANHAWSVLRRLQIMDSALPNPHFRSRQAQCVRTLHCQTLGSGLSGSFKLSRPLHSDPHGYRSSACHQDGENVTPWIRAFHNVVQLHVELQGWGGLDNRASLVPFHGLSPAIRSLRLKSSVTQPSVNFELLCSFSLLEELESLRSPLSTCPMTGLPPRPSRGSPGLFC